MKPRIALVVQRYGLEVNGGSEYSCRMIAERLSNYYEVDILTTKAIDYMTWGDYYPSDLEVINKVNVRRFSTDSRDIKAFNKYSEQIYNNLDRTIFEEMEWMRKQGPISNDLLRYIKDNSEVYKAIIFFTYVYGTTFLGLQLIPEKSILVPTAHDEPPIYLSIFKPFFHLPRHIMYLTKEEAAFVQSKFNNQYIPSSITGLGLNTPDAFLTEQQFRNKFNIQNRYVIYVGRIDESKGCKQLFEYFIRYKSENPSELKLILLGKQACTIPDHTDIVPLGFVSEEDKFGGIQGSECLLMPSKYESFSIIVIESLAMKIPVLVNGESDVLKGHCEEGNAGLYYMNYDEFSAGLSLLLNNDRLKLALGKSGHSYVKNNFDWDVIIGKFVDSIEGL